jgi:hypothetical protein
MNSILKYYSLDFQTSGSEVLNKFISEESVLLIRQIIYT